MEESVKSDLLTTWDQIASVVGRTPRTAQLWVKTRGLPVRYPHGKGLPIASRQEILKWLAAGNASEPAATRSPATLMPDVNRSEPNERASSKECAVESEMVGTEGPKNQAHTHGLHRTLGILMLAVSPLVAWVAIALMHRTAPPGPLSGEAAKLYRDSWTLLSEKHDAAWLPVANMMTVAIARQPGHPDLYNLRGLAYRAMGEYRRAIEDFNIVIASRPNDGRAYYNRGAASNALGEHRKAIEDLNKAIELAPHDPSRDLFYQERGIAFKKLARGQRDRLLFLRAFADFKEVIKVKANNGWAWHELGSVRLALEEPEKAMADFDHAEKLLAPENRYWLYQDRADVKQHLGDYQGASADRKRAELLTEKR